MNLKQIKIRLLAFSLVSLTYATLTSCDSELELIQSIDEEFTNISSIEIDAGFLEVNYQGDENTDVVTLVGSLEANKSGKYKIEYRVEQGKLKIELEKNGTGALNSRGRINLRGPARMEFDLESGSANSQIHNLVSNKFEFEGGSGNLELTNLKADRIDLKLGSGNISGFDLVGNVGVDITSGNVSVSNLTGNLNAKGSSGKFTFSTIEGIVNSSLNSGNAEMTGVKELGNLKVSSGNYTIVNSSLGGSTTLESASGNFNIQTNSDLGDFNFDLKTSSGNLRVGESTSTGSLKIDNGSPYTVSGVVSSGNIQIEN